MLRAQRYTFACTAITAACDRTKLGRIGAHHLLFTLTILRVNHPSVAAPTRIHAHCHDDFVMLNGSML